MMLDTLPAASHERMDEAARVRMGASRDTAPDILLALANDPAVTVRAAVAMNAAAPAHVDTLLARDADERVRTLLARKLAALIPAMPEAERDRLQEQAFTTLAGLVEDEAERVRAGIAQVVRDMPAAPRGMILQLAHDSALSVCDPVIRLSPLLSAEDLLALLAATPSPGTATAVARRANLSEAVSDHIAASSDAGAIAALLSNHSAAIRESTLDALATRAREHEAWHEPLVRRPALSARAARALSDIVASQLLDELASRADLDTELKDELRRRLTDRLAPKEVAAPPKAEPDIAVAIATAERLRDADALSEQVLAEAVRRGEIRMATAMLAVAAGVNALVVERAATLRSAKGLVSLVWKAGFSMQVAGPLQILLARLAPNAILRPNSSGDFPLAVEEMRWQIDFLSRMGR